MIAEKGYARMELDMERIMILLQRKYSAGRELDRLTKELEETVARNDGISAAMVLEMRDDEMIKADRCMEEIWQLGEEDREAYEKIKALVECDLSQAVGETKEEKKIYEIRRKTQAVLEGLRRTDERLNRRLAGTKSFYRDKEAVSLRP